MKTFDVDFDSLLLRNFGCIEEAFLPLRDQGVVLLKGENLDEGGSNGSGKTTLLDGFSTVITGTAGKHGVRKNDYLPIDRQGNIRGGLEAIAEYHRLQRHYVAAHYRKHKQYGTDVVLTEDGVDISSTSSKSKIDETQKLILKSTGLTEREWYGSVYLPQHHSHRLVMGTPKEKKDYLSAHFGLSDTDACINVSTKWLNAIELPDDTALKELLASCIERLAELRDQDALIEKRAELTSRQGALGKRQVDLQVEIRGLEAAKQVEAQRIEHNRAIAPWGYQLHEVVPALVDGLRARLRDCEHAQHVHRQRHDLEAKLSGLDETDPPETLRQEMSEAQSKLQALTDLGTKLARRQELQAKLDGVPTVEDTRAVLSDTIEKTRKRLALFESKAKIITAEVQKLRTLDSKCSMCMRDITAEERDRMIGEREAHLREYSTILPEMQRELSLSEANLRTMATAIETRARLEADMHGLPEGDIDAARSEYNELRTRLSALTSAVGVAMTRKSLLDQIHALPETTGNPSEIPDLQARIQLLTPVLAFTQRYGDVRFSEEAYALANTVYAETSTEYGRVSTELAETVAAITERERLVRQKADIERQLQKASQERQRKRVLEVLQVVLKDVRAKALRDCTEMLRSALPLYVRHLFPRGDVSVELAEEEDSLDFYLRKGGGQQVPMSLVSGGQAKRVGLAVLFAFAKLGAKTSNVLIADEPYKDLDAQGRECAFDLFHDLGIPTVIVTSHDQDQLREKRYDKVLTMRMQHGVSRLVEG